MEYPTRVSWCSVWLVHFFVKKGIWVERWVCVGVCLWAKLHWHSLTIGILSFSLRACLLLTTMDSHEYGHACILPIDDWKDPRFALTGAILSAYLVITLVWTWHAWSYYWRTTAKVNHQPFPMGWILWMVHLSWMVTLFPITGIVKVGTFVADRIVVQASVGTSMLVAYWLSTWLMRNGHRRKRFVNVWNPSHWTFREVLVVLLLAFSWRRIHKRTTEWLGPVPLLESSLRTCPRSAKSHLEYSKTLSGMFPDRTGTYPLPTMYKESVGNFLTSHCHHHHVNDI